MPDTSHALSLPLIQPSQAHKHVTHNEALRILDAVVQLVVIAADQSGPPTVPQSGDRYIVAPSGVGAWLGHDGDIAVYADAAWSFITPLPGWTAQVLAPQSAVLFDAVLGWQTVSTTLENTAELDWAKMTSSATKTSTNATSLPLQFRLKNGSSRLWPKDLSGSSAGHMTIVNFKTRPSDTVIKFKTETPA